MEELKAERESLPENQQEIVDRLIFTVEDMNRNPDDLQAQFPAILKVLRDLGDLAPTNFETQLAIASSFHLQVTNAANLNLDSEPILQETLQRSRQLVTTFPKEAKAYGNLGFVLMMNKGDQNEARRMLEKCIELDSSVQQCHDYYDQLTGSL